MSKAAHEAFIKAAGSAAKKSEKQTGVPASVTVAQAILESGWGEVHMGDANNYFGIRAQVRNGKIEFGDVASGYVDKITKEYDRTEGPTPSSHISADIRPWRTRFSTMGYS